MPELDPTFGERVDPPPERLAQLSVDREAVWNLQQLLVQRPQALLGHRRVDLRALGAVELSGARLGRGIGLELAGLDLPLELLVDLLELGGVLATLGGDVIGGD